MRNLKRVLSLALASVMLLGMMVVGTSAAFSDADEVVYKEAVEITAGLGLFAGADGKFNPKGTLTRAEMATVIVKMLYGSDYNADSWKGLGKFPDTADYQGGWAEGYIALCASLGIVGGYPNGNFEPGNPVNAAEAATMIINALDLDAGKGEWPATVMTKADDMKLFDGLNVKPGAYQALTRDELAAIVLVGVNYSPAGKGGYYVGSNTAIVFDNLSDAVVAALASGLTVDDIHPVPAQDSLATKVFGMKSEVGYIVENQATGAACTILSTGLKLDLKTGADMVGHYVTAYFAEEYVDADEPGKAYAIVDEAKYITVAAEIKEADDVKKAFGSKTTAAADADAYVFGGDATEVAEALSTKWTSANVKVGTYVVVDNKVIGYIAPLTVYAGEVDKVEAKKITIDGTAYANEVGKDFIVEYEGIAKDDVILYNKIGDVVVVEEAGYIEGKVTKITGTKIYVDGAPYEFTSANVEESALLTKDDVNFKTTYKVYLDNSGKYIGLKAPGAAPSTEATLDDIYYVYEVFTKETVTETVYGDKATITYYANVVDMAGKNTQIVIGIATEGADLKGATELDKGFYTFAAATGANAGTMKATMIKDSYDKNAKNLYYSSMADTELKTSTVYVASAEAFLTAETKFILIKDEDPDNASALKTLVTNGAIDKTRTTAAELVLGVDAKGNVVIKAMVIETSDLAAAEAAPNVVYVTPAQVKGASQIGDDLYELNVYFVADGKIYTITTKDDLTKVETGFYTVQADSKGVYDLVAPYATNIVAGVKFERLFGEKLMITDEHAAGIDISKAYVVDIRPDSAAKGDYSAAIDSIEDIEAASAKGNVIMDLVTKDGKVTGIYVLSSKK